MSNILEFSHSLSTIGKHDFAVDLKPPLTLNTPSRGYLQMRCDEMTISGNPCNFFNSNTLGGNFNNSMICIWRVNMSTPPDRIYVNIPQGFYRSPSWIAAVLNSAIVDEGWTSSLTASVVTIGYDSEFDRIFIRIDDTQMLPVTGGLVITFDSLISSPDIAATLGFPSSGAGATISGAVEKIGWYAPVFFPQGSSVLVCSSLCPSRRYNGQELPILCSIDMDIKPLLYQSIFNDDGVIWPTLGVKSPKFPITLPPKLYSYRIYCLASDGKPMIFSSGNLKGKVEIQSKMV
jgi:hypothetical protein